MPTPNSNVDGADEQKTAPYGVFMPPHLRKKACISKPSHTQVSAVPSTDDHENTDSLKPIVFESDESTAAESIAEVHHSITLSPPMTPPPPTGLSLGSPNAFSWKPHYITTLPPLPSEITQRIPRWNLQGIKQNDFNQLFQGAISWSPGLYFLPVELGASPLLNRCYYLIDETLEPFAPAALGQHGAKLVAMFNPDNPEDVYHVPEKYGIYSDSTPLFIAKEVRGQKFYYYYGHYSQTRWSDKVDYDRMVASIPKSIREHWAELLSAKDRPEWMTNELMNLFWPKPEYEAGDAKVAGDAQMEKNIKRYMKRLQSWEETKRLKLKSGALNKTFLLDAFERADADQPAPLRFYLEYLECVNWDKSFYDIVSRDDTL